MHENDNDADKQRGAIAILCDDHYNGWYVKGSTYAPLAEAWVSDKGYPCMHNAAVFESTSDAQTYLELNRDVLTKRCSTYGFLGFEVVQMTMWPDPTSFTPVVALQPTQRSRH